MEKYKDNMQNCNKMKTIIRYAALIAAVLPVIAPMRAQEINKESYKVYEMGPSEWDATGLLVYEREDVENGGMPLFYHIGADGATISSPLWYVDEGERMYRYGVYAGTIAIPSKLPDGRGGQVEVRGIEAFRNNGVTELRIPSTVRSLGNSLRNCDMLEKLEIEEGIEEISGMYYCMYLRECRLPSSVKYVADGSMQYLGLREMTLPPLLTEVGDSALAFNYQMERLDLGNLRTAGKWAFSHSQSLKKLVLPESLESLGEGCFAFCCALEEIWLPSHEVKWGGKVFNYTTGLKRVVATSPTPYPMDGVEIDRDNIDLYVPAGSEDLYRKSSYWQHAKGIYPISELPE